MPCSLKAPGDRTGPGAPPDEGGIFGDPGVCSGAPNISAPGCHRIMPEAWSPILKKGRGRLPWGVRRSSSSKDRSRNFKRSSPHIPRHLKTVGERFQSINPGADREVISGNAIFCRRME
jgi:hypothetical protein